MTATQAWLLMISLSILIYGWILNRVVPKIRRTQQLKDRVNRHGAKAMQEWQDVTRMDVRQLKKVRIEDRFQNLLESRKSWARDIQYLIYRSGGLQNTRIKFLTFLLVASLWFLLLIKTTPFLTLYCLLMSLLLSLVVHFYYLKYMARSWQKNFIRLFPQSLDIIIRSLRSGLTLGRGLALVSEEIEDPVGTEFHYIVSQLQLGIPPEFAYREAADRIGTDDFRVFAIALIIQKEMGGSLTDILTKLAEVIRDREKFRNKVWTMSSEARTTAMIIGSLPFVTALGIELINPGYLKFFIADDLGIKMLITALSLNTIGLFIISRMIKFED